MPTFDVVLHTNTGIFGANAEQLLAANPPVKDRVQAVAGLWIERPDGTLAKVRPTSVGFRYAGRVQHKDDSLSIVPAEIHGVSVDTFLSPGHRRDWLAKPKAELAVEIDAKSEPLTPPSFPQRVSRALWYYDYAQRTYYADLRWII